MTARLKLSTIGWSFRPNCTEWLHLLNEVNIPDILSILIDCWVTIALTLEFLRFEIVLSIFVMILVVGLNAV